MPKVVVRGEVKYVGGGDREVAGNLDESWFSGVLEADDRWRCVEERGRLTRGGGKPCHHGKGQGESTLLGRESRIKAELFLEWDR